MDERTLRLIGLLSSQKWQYSHIYLNCRYFNGQHWQHPKWGAGENTRQPWPPGSRLAVGWADLSAVELSMWGYSEEEEGCRDKGDLDHVPDEVLEQIFTNRDLTYRDLVPAGQTCQYWLLFCKIIKQIELSSSILTLMYKYKQYECKLMSKLLKYKL